ncbi:PREDICTED: uncharacterized protein LOC104710672 [Camelina sativa]|uniref:Uncharacterized protein LOC104710672 n=1 Tax=Camelina sativa TaxID=90675 RepID=A0ABM0TFE0_CAMSA|nr:PREDICTED: uncharacterized protein LOC104710672 [Camelina sativa]
MGRFQFDFDQEEDIIEVLKMEPYHFDHWMLSLVRWEPVVDHKYPYLIKFWVRMMGVPLHFWADETFRSIGSDLGEVVEVDIDNGRVQVLFDGFKPLVFEAAVEFHSGEETLVILRYERLYGYCRRCFSLCHDVSRCPLFGNNGKQAQASGTDPRPEDKLQSYKGAVASGSNSGSGSGVRGARSGDPQGYAVGGGRDAGGCQADSHRHKQGFGHKSKRARRDFQPKEQIAQKPSMAGTTVPVVGEGVGPAQETEGDVGIHLSATEQTMLDAFLVSAAEEVAVPSIVEASSGEDNRVCKNLFPVSVAQNVTTRGVMAQDQQEDLLSAALSDLLDQEFHLPDTREIGGLAPILEEHGVATELPSEEDTPTADEEVTFVTKECGLGDPQVQGDAVVVEGATTDTVHDSAVEGGVPPPRFKSVKTKGVLPGASTKKRNLYALASPRKKMVASVSTMGMGVQETQVLSREGSLQLIWVVDVECLYELAWRGGSVFSHSFLGFTLQKTGFWSFLCLLVLSLFLVFNNTTMGAPLVCLNFLLLFPICGFFGWVCF